MHSSRRFALKLLFSEQLFVWHYTTQLVQFCLVKIASFRALTLAGAPLRGGGTVRPPSTPLPGYCRTDTCTVTTVQRVSV